MDFFFQTEENLAITPLKKGKDRFFYVVTYGDSSKQAHEASKDVFEQIRFYSANGDELMKQNFKFDEFYSHE